MRRVLSLSSLFPQGRTSPDEKQLRELQSVGRQIRRELVAEEILQETTSKVRRPGRDGLLVGAPAASLHAQPHTNHPLTPSLVLIAAPPGLQGPLRALLQAAGHVTAPLVPASPFALQRLHLVSRRFQYSITPY